MRFFLSIALVLGACNCEGDARPEAETPESATAPAPVPRGPVGSVEGVVRLAAGAELPSYAPIRWEGRGTRPEICPPPHIGDREPVHMEDDRALVGLMVAVDATALEENEVTPPAPTVRELVIRNCKLEPMFITATRGDTLRIKNEDDYPFLPSQVGANQYRALLQGQTTEIALDEGNVLQFECAFAAPCGTADVVVSYHPLHALTGEGGRFRIDNVPANRALRIVAWHPLFLESAVSINVANGESETVQIEISPAPRPEPPPDTSMDEAPAENDPGLF
jgi:hypothetical protein